MAWLLPPFSLHTPLVRKQHAIGNKHCLWEETVCWVHEWNHQTLFKSLPLGEGWPFVTLLPSSLTLNRAYSSRLWTSETQKVLIQHLDCIFLSQTVYNSVRSGHWITSGLSLLQQACHQKTAPHKWHGLSKCHTCILRHSTQQCVSIFTAGERRESVYPSFFVFSVSKPN